MSNRQNLYINKTKYNKSAKDQRSYLVQQKCVKILILHLNTLTSKQTAITIRFNTKHSLNQQAKSLKLAQPTVSILKLRSTNSVNNKH